MNASTLHVDIGQSGRDCELSASYSRCSDPNTEVEGNVTSVSETDVRIEIDSVEMFYGNDVIVKLNDICDPCGETFYIPDMATTG